MRRLREYRVDLRLASYDSLYCRRTERRCGECGRIWRESPELEKAAVAVTTV